MVMDNDTVQMTDGVSHSSTITTDDTTSNAWKKAESTPWLIVKQLFDESISKYVSAAQSATSSKDWSDLVEISIPMTMNSNNSKFCCWECGGAKQTSGYALLIGEPNGSKPLAMSAFRKCGVPNGKQAVVQLYYGCLLVLATQSRGVGSVLIYRADNFNIQESVYVQQNYRNGRLGSSTEGELVTHFVMNCQLNKVFDITTHEVRQFSTNINDITLNSDIVKTAIRKSTIYNCDRALYIRPFFKLKDGEEDWNIDDLRVEDTYIKSNRVSSFLTETLAQFSTLVRGMEPRTFPYLGIKIENVVEKEDEDSPDTVLVKLAVFTNKASHAWNIYVTKKIFNQHRDYFMVSSWEKFLAIANDDTGHFKKSYVCKYAAN